MSATTIALASAGGIFLGALLGIGLRRRLPDHHLGKETQDVVKLSAGMIGTLTAMVLGLLVSSAKSSFDAMNNGVVQASAKFIMMDRALDRYGPEALSTRNQLRQALAGGLDAIWSTGNDVSGTAAFERGHGIEVMQDKLRELTPQGETQRQALAQAQQIAGELAQTRWLLIEQAHDELPLPLLLVLVLWLTLLFVGFGLFAPANATAVTVLFLGACAVSIAIFLVIELNRPLDGWVKISNAPLRNALQHLGESASTR